MISWNPNFKTDGGSHPILFTVMVLKEEFIKIQADFLRKFKKHDVRRWARAQWTTEGTKWEFRKTCEFHIRFPFA